MKLSYAMMEEIEHICTSGGRVLPQFIPARTLRSLFKRDLVEPDVDGSVRLTEKGKALAKRLRMLS